MERGAGLMGDPVTTTLALGAGSSIMGGMADRAAAKGEQQRAEANAYIAETRGVYRGEWSIEEVGEQMDAVRDTDGSLILPPVPSGHVDHIRYSFEMAGGGGQRS